LGIDKEKMDIAQKYILKVQIEKAIKDFEISWTQFRRSAIELNLGKSLPEKWERIRDRILSEGGQALWWRRFKFRAISIYKKFAFDKVL